MSAATLNRRAMLLALLGGSAVAGASLAQTIPQPAPNPQTGPQTAPDPDPRLVEAADQIAFGYVVTGEGEVDRASDAGLKGLGDALWSRTTVEPGPPVAVDLDQDDLTLLTFLYWPVTDAQPLPTPQAYVRLNQFLRTGGVILFDTRDGDIAATGSFSGGSTALRDLASPLEVPPLAVLTTDHVLTRTFYLMDDLPGRYMGAQIWVEAPVVPAEGEADPAPLQSRNDGVSPVIIGGNAWAEAWAVDADGLPLFSVGRGFEGEQQRELALRAGINIAMYVLTGNYKSDQVHVPALLERLGLEEQGAAAQAPFADDLGGTAPARPGGGPPPGSTWQDLYTPPPPSPLPGDDP